MFRPDRHCPRALLAPFAFVFAVLLGSLAVAPAPTFATGAVYSHLSRALNGEAVVSLPDTFAVDNEQLLFDELGWFDETLTVQAGVNGTSGQGTATQRSFIGAGGFTATGSMQASATNVDPEGFGEGFSRSFFNVHFTVDAPTDLELTGTLRQTKEDGRALLSLLGPGDVILYIETLAPGEIPISETVPLEANTLYRFATWTGGFGQAFEGLQIAAAGDFEIAGSIGGGLGAPIRVAGRDGPVVAPNPVRSFARILQPATGARVDVVQIVDVAGRAVRRLETSGAETTWDTRDAAGAPVPAGVYFLRFLGAGNESTRKVQVLR